MRKHGCLQTYASETWLIKKLVLYHSSPDTYLHQLVNDEHEITPRDLKCIRIRGHYSRQADHLGSESIDHDHQPEYDHRLQTRIYTRRVIQYFKHGRSLKQLDFEPNLYAPSKQELIIKPYSLYQGDRSSRICSLSYAVIQRIAVLPSY